MHGNCCYYKALYLCHSDNSKFSESSDLATHFMHKCRYSSLPFSIFVIAKSTFMCSGNVSLHATCHESYVSGGILAGKLAFSLVII